MLYYLFNYLDQLDFPGAGEFVLEKMVPYLNYCFTQFVSVAMKSFSFDY